MHKPLVEIRAATVHVQGHRALSDIDWTQLANENWAVVGNNGSGKTTFTRLVFGELLPVHGGEVLWFGLPWLTPLEEIRQKMGYISAEYQENHANHLVGWEVVASGIFSTIGLYERVTRSQKARALEWMDFLGIGHLARSGFRRLSYGEARRVLLARALVNEPELLILDEPCNGLDIPTRELFLATLEKLSGTRTRILYVTHHVDEIMPCITHLLYLKDGRLFDQGKKSALLTETALSKALDCPIRLKKSAGRYWVTGRGLPEKKP